MPTMPYWLAKTSEMIAMDRWFSLDDAGSENVLIDRYTHAIARVSQPGTATMTGNSAALNNKLPANPFTATPAAAFGHFDAHWLNLNNLSSGGDYWPQIPSASIIIWLRTGVAYAAKKALGVHNQPPGSNLATLFAYEQTIDPNDPREAVLPVVTCWVCTGASSFEVDAVRGPTAVQLVIATPPPYQKAHMWDEIRPQLDAWWSAVHPNAELPDLVPDDSDG